MRFFIVLCLFVAASAGFKLRRPVYMNSHYAQGGGVYAVPPQTGYMESKNSQLVQIVNNNNNANYESVQRPLGYHHGLGSNYNVYPQAGYNGQYYGNSGGSAAASSSSSAISSSLGGAAAAGSSASASSWNQNNGNLGYGGYI